MRTGLIGVCAMVLLVFSRQAMEGAQAGAGAFVTGVMPALLPMMVLGRMLPVRENHERFTLGARICTALFAMASGSPAAAQRLSQSGWQDEAMYALTGVMSPLFLTGTLAHWTGDAALGRRMLWVHWAGAVLTAVCWRLFSPPKAPGPVQASPRPALAQAVSGAAQAMLGVCGVMMLFSAAAGTARALLDRLFPVWTAQNDRMLSILWALTEIGGGLHAVLKADPGVSRALLCALCGFGGLSIWLQNALFCAQSIRPAKLLGMRALHGALSYGLWLVTERFFLP